MIALLVWLLLLAAIDRWRTLRKKSHKLTFLLLSLLAVSIGLGVVGVAQIGEPIFAALILAVPVQFFVEFGIRVKAIDDRNKELLRLIRNADKQVGL